MQAGSGALTWAREEAGGVQRTAIIGDVHGMRDALAELLGVLRLGPGDRLVFAGDLVDKGPDSAGVVEDAARLAREAAFEVVLVEGNHEERHRRYRANLTLRPKVARQQAADAPELPAITERLSPEACAFLDGAVWFHREAEHGVLVVHGGIPGDMRVFPDRADDVAALTGKARDRFSKILRTRFISRETGTYLGLGKQQPGDPFWAEVYDGRFGHVVFGHQPFFDGPAVFPHATGIDTGAVHGTGLTALVYEAGAERRFVSVATPVYRARRTLDPSDA